jgi:hypothetical protein
VDVPEKPKPKTISLGLVQPFSLAGVDMVAFQAGISRGFKAWANICGLTFVGSARPDVLISLRYINAWGCVLKGREIVISTHPTCMAAWKTNPGSVDSLIIHEFGHVIGLKDYPKGDHPGSVMNWGQRPSTPGPEDIKYAQSKYGPPVARETGEELELPEVGDNILDEPVDWEGFASYRYGT